MSGQLKIGTRAKALLIGASVGAFVYMFMPSCTFLADADDTLCHAIAASDGALVDWPEEERWYGDPMNACHVFDNVMVSPWWFSQDACDYIEGFGLAQGHNWDELGRADARTYNDKTLEVDTPLARTYNGYANLVFANLESIDLDRGRSLGDFEYYDTFLKWAAAYVSQKTYRVNGNCARHCETVESSRCIIARTVSGPLRNDYIDLYQTFFYDIDSVWRASTIVHEVRHARDQALHSGGTGCSRGSACDRSWSWAGANTYEMLWLAAYYWTPEDHPFITPARRARAQVLFEALRQGSFNDPVQWKLEHFAFINEIPDFYVHEAACSNDPDNPNRCLYLAN